MSQTQGRPRRSYASAGAYVNGSSALKSAPAYAPSYETAAPRRPAPQSERRNAPKPTPRTGRNPRRRRAFSPAQAVLILMALATVIVGSVWLAQCARYSALQTQVDLVRASITAQEKTNQILEQELTALKNGERIRTYAVNRLGMIAPGKGEERTISINLPRTQEAIADTQEETHYTLLDVLLDMLWF